VEESSITLPPRLILHFRGGTEDETPGMDFRSFDAGFARVGGQETHRATTQGSAGYLAARQEN
jgi:hypothetical protein